MFVTIQVFYTLSCRFPPHQCLPLCREESDVRPLTLQAPLVSDSKNNQKCILQAALVSGSKNNQKCILQAPLASGSDACLVSVCLCVCVCVSCASYMVGLSLASVRIFRYLYTFACMLVTLHVFYTYPAGYSRISAYHYVGKNQISAHSLCRHHWRVVLMRVGKCVSVRV